MRTGALVSLSAQTSHFLICIWGLLKNECVDYDSPPPCSAPAAALLMQFQQLKRRTVYLLIFIISFAYVSCLISLPSSLRGASSTLLVKCPAVPQRHTRDNGKEGHSWGSTTTI